MLLLEIGEERSRAVTGLLRIALACAADSTSQAVRDAALPAPVEPADAAKTASAAAATVPRVTFLGSSLQKKLRRG